MSERQVIPFYGNLRQNLSDLPKARPVILGIRGLCFCALPFAILTCITTAKSRHCQTQEMVLKKN